MSDRFVPDDYEPPKKSGKYLKLKPGETVIRVLSPKPLMGEEGWKERGGKRVPVRKPVGAVWKAGEYDTKSGDRNPLKHFWALAVWNYGEQRVQVLEITQTTIMQAIQTLSRNKKWGHPSAYDLCISATGDGMDREYSVMPEPKTPLLAEGEAAWREAQAKGFDLTRLFTGGDPFNEDEPGKGGSFTAEYDELNPPPPEDADVPF